MSSDQPNEHHLSRVVAATGAPRSRAVIVDRSTLDNMMHLPRDKAAQMLGLCSTTFKKVCRRAGLKVWPYRRLLLGCNQEGDTPMTFSRHFTEPPAFPAILLQMRIAPQPMMPLRYVDLSSPSFPSSSSSSSSSSPSMAAAANAACSLRYLAPSTAQMSCPSGQSTHVVDAVMDYLDTLSSGQSTHVVDAVMDYLDTLSSGPPAAEDRAALHRCELEAVVEGLDCEVG